MIPVDPSIPWWGNVIGYVCLAAIAVMVLLPSKWDPAIRLKEYNERKRREREGE